MAAGPLRTALAFGAPALVAFLLVDRPIRYALGLASFLTIALSMRLAAGGTVLLSERSFFGVHRVISRSDDRYRTLLHGVTIHGTQDRDEQFARTPLTYYYPTGPIGQVLTKANERPSPLRVGIVGMGVGSLAAYARSQDNYTFFEIDPVVIKVATDPKWFTFLSDAKTKVRIVEGDARLMLKNEPSGEDGFDVLAVDAFSSDAIPLHLLTVEAIELYLNRVRPDGALVIHISNHYLDLERPLKAIVNKLGVHGRIAEDLYTMPEEKLKGKQSSVWFMIARDPSVFEAYAPFGSFTTIDDIKPTSLWTDARSNALEAWNRKSDEP